MIEFYLQNRINLVCLFVLIDLRLPPQKIDIEFIHWCGENSIPFVITGTKADKIKPGKVTEQVQLYQETLNETWEELPLFMATSSETGLGRTEMLDYMSKCMGLRQ